MTARCAYCDAAFECAPNRLRKARWGVCCSVVCAQAYRREREAKSPPKPRSHRIVTLVCDLKVAPKCRQTWQTSYRVEQKTRAGNDGKILCLYCSRALKSAGRRNPNCRHSKIDDRFFQKVEKEEQAYLLGWIASDGYVRADGVALAIHKADRPLLERLRDTFCDALPIREEGNLVQLTINSQEIARDVCRWLTISPGQKSATVGFPALGSSVLSWAFLRGYFDGDGHINRPGLSKNYPRCSISTNSARMRSAIRSFCQIRCSESSGKLEWSGNNALDFMARLYDGASIYLLRKHDLYLDWSSWVPSLSGGKNYGRDNALYWNKTDLRAVPPFKERATDSGYDLTLIRRVKRFGVVDVFGTGLKVQPPYGWYFDLVPRSSIIKTGYFMVNSFGVIDRTYQGEIQVALLKLDPNGPELVLPCRLVQLIPRPIIHLPVREVPSLTELGGEKMSQSGSSVEESLSPKERGEGGFGSTGT